MKLELAFLSLTLCGSSSLTAGGNPLVSGEGSWGHVLSRAGELDASDRALTRISSPWERPSLRTHGPKS